MASAKTELESLWTALFGGPPAINAEPEMLATILVAHAPPPPPYQYNEVPLRLAARRPRRATPRRNRRQGSI
jgi:hypothetical protein